MLFTFVATTACASGEETKGAAAQREEWTDDDRPSIFAAGLERRLSALPASGEATRVPWPGSYWPAWKDSVNLRWDGDGSKSPAEKYEAAFGATGVADAVSDEFGIDSFSRAKACQSRSDCESSEHCAKRRDSDPGSGRCVPGWVGICHGWAAASILLPEPLHPVVRNGVTFKVADIKALITLVHDATETRFLSDRCDEDSSKDDFKYDAHGRPDPACRDTNPGTFHVVVTNSLGLKQSSFVIDRAFDIEVWNQPLRSYKIKEQRTVTAQEASSLVDPPEQGASPPDTYPYNPEAVSFTYIRNDVSYIAESTPDSDGNLASSIDRFTVVLHYQYVLELDGDGRIIGGEWAGDSKRRHPDFLWRPIRAVGRNVAHGKISFNIVKSLAEASVAPEVRLAAPVAGAISRVAIPGSVE